MAFDLDDQEYEATRKMFNKDEIEVGEYVRTEFGNIGKFYRPASENSDVYCIYIEPSGLKYTTRYDCITKHSKNITDLIEVGDVVEIIDVLNQEVCYIWDKEMLDAVKEDIKIGLKLKRILTKEQFDENCYVVEE